MTELHINEITLCAFLFFFCPQAAMRTGAFLALPAPPLGSLERAPVYLCWTYLAHVSWLRLGLQHVCRL